MWVVTNRADQYARVIADRHYNRQSVGSTQFVPPGRCLVLITDDGTAVWVTSWPFAEYVKHQWAGAMVNSLFRNEGQYLSSELIREAVDRTIEYWQQLPELGIVSFVNAHKVIPKRYPGWCYRKAGWRHVGYTKGGLYTYQFGESERLRQPDQYRRHTVVTTENSTTSTTDTTKEGETKQRKRIDPRVKMVRALHSIIGEQLREYELKEAHATTGAMLEYLGQLTND